MSKYTGEKQKSPIVNINYLKVVQGKYYKNGKLFKFKLASYKEVGIEIIKGVAQYVDKEGNILPEGHQMREAWNNKLVSRYLEKVKEIDIAEAKSEAENKSDSLIKDVLDAWIRDGEANKSESTVKKFYEPTKKRYLKENPNHLINNINKDHINRFKLSLKHLSFDYGNIQIKTLKTFLRWAARNKDARGIIYLKEVPEIEFFPRVEKLPEIYSDHEIARLLKHINGKVLVYELLEEIKNEKDSEKRRSLETKLKTVEANYKTGIQKPDTRHLGFAKLHQRCIYAFIGTGFRRSEVAFLEWDQLDLDDGIIKLKSKKKYNFKIKENKGSKRLILPFALSFFKKEALKARLSGEKFFLDNGEGEPAYQNDLHSITTAFTRYKKKLNLNPEAAAVHSLRAVFASLAEHVGVDTLTISEMMGHASIETTKRYLGRPTKRLRKAIELMDKHMQLVLAA